MKTIIYSIIAGSLLLLSLSAHATTPRKEYARKYKHIAIKEMERVGIPASIKMAQGILESGCGKSELAVNANNHFGIKCHDWTGPTYRMDDDARNECFRKYKNPEQSWMDHSTFLTSRPRYAGLFNLPKTDYRAWARGLKAAGYATNPQYADLLIKIIEEEELYKLDDPKKYKDDKEEKTITLDEFAESTGKGGTTQVITGNHGNSSYRNREEIRNGIICIEAIPGDTYNKIASYYNIKLKKLLSYNDKKDTSLKQGELVFIKRKKTKAARGYEYHRIKGNESLHDISQMYGVRLNNILKYNYLTPGSKLIEGEKIYLRKKADVF